MFKAQEILRKVRSGELVVGAHVFFAHYEITEASAGWDTTLCGSMASIPPSIGRRFCRTLLQPIQAAPHPLSGCLERPNPDQTDLGNGAGWDYPSMIYTAEQARQAVAACTYPPEGIRGFGPRRANRYGTMDTEEYLAQVNQSFLRIMQIEHYQGVEDLEEIMAVPGVDVIMVGPNDLSASLGLLGQTRHPKVMKYFDLLAEKCLKANKPFGVSLCASDEASIRDWIDRGVNLIGCADDLGLVRTGGQQTLAFVQELRKNYEAKVKKED